MHHSFRRALGMVILVSLTAGEARELAAVVPAWVAPEPRSIIRTIARVRTLAAVDGGAHAGMVSSPVSPTATRVHQPA